MKPSNTAPNSSEATETASTRAGGEAKDTIEVEAIGLEIDHQPIELFKTLKIAQLVNDGAQAKHLIAAGQVYVNGEQETRKRRKIYADDVVYFDGEYFLILCESPVTIKTPRERQNYAHSSDDKGSQPRATEQLKQAPKKARKAISFSTTK